MSRRLTAAVAALVVGCAPAEGRQLDDEGVTELERLVDYTSELVGRTEQGLKLDPR
ncbi:MAG TPA: hypothetical protein VHI11_11525 [Jiangellaceae bacterium]|jgi:hypothetical protein|nr:hypothetical protein [Jiangellaceae bacterium]